MGAGLPGQCWAGPRLLGMCCIPLPCDPVSVQAHRHPRGSLQQSCIGEWEATLGGPQAGFCTSSQLHSPPLLPQLQGLLTLFAKSFASFDHSTCALSVPGQYSALQWIHLALQTAVPSHSTPGSRQCCTQARQCSGGTGHSPSDVGHSRALPDTCQVTQQTTQSIAHSICWIPR